MSWQCGGVPVLVLIPVISFLCTIAWRSAAKLVAELMVSISQEENRVPLREEGGRKSFQCLRQHFHLYSPIICALGYTDSSAHWTFHQHIQGYGKTPERSPRTERTRLHLSVQRFHLGETGRHFALTSLPSLPPCLLVLPFLWCSEKSPGLSYNCVYRL